MPNDYNVAETTALLHAVEVEPQRGTPRFYLRNLRLAERLWAQVPEGQVASDLNYWMRHSAYSCNTTACFGGWVAQWQEFRNLGISPNCLGAPVVTTRRGEFRSGTEVGNYLFGCPQIFHSRLNTRSNLLSRRRRNRMSDHQIVTNRIQRGIARWEKYIQKTVPV